MSAFLYSLLLTLAVECAALLPLYKAIGQATLPHKRVAGIGFSVNLLTNPTLNLLLFFVTTLWPALRVPAIILLELLAVLTEAILYHSLLALNKQKSAFLSLLLNALSFSVSLLLL